MGFRHAAVGALVRSSYHADQQAEEVLAAIACVSARAAAGRQRPRRPRVARPQQPHPALLAHPAGLASGLVAEAPEEIGAHRAADRAARVLRHHQPLERPRRQRIGRREEHRRAERNRARIDGDRAPASSGTPSAPIGPSIAASSDPGRGAGTSRKKT